LTRCLLAALDADCIDRVVTELKGSSYGIFGRWKEPRRVGGKRVGAFDLLGPRNLSLFGGGRAACVPRS
jgi:hypothetical protein